MLLRSLRSTHTCRQHHVDGTHAWVLLNYQQITSSWAVSWAIYRIDFISRITYLEFCSNIFVFMSICVCVCNYIYFHLNVTFFSRILLYIRDVFFHYMLSLLVASPRLTKYLYMAYSRVVFDYTCAPRKLAHFTTAHFLIHTYIQTAKKYFIVIREIVG